MKILDGLKPKEVTKRVVISLYLNKEATDNLSRVTEKMKCTKPELFNHFSKLAIEELSILINKRRRKDKQLNDNSNGDRFSINLKVETKSNLDKMSDSLNLNLSKLTAMLLDLANREL